MSTEYFISNRNKREEIQAFNKFWEEKLIAGLKTQINNYCNEVDGDYVNINFAEDIIMDKVSKISYAPADTTSYETKIGSSRWNGKRTLFQWEGACINDHVIRDEMSLVDFFADKDIQKQYYITDEYNAEYTFNEFLDKIRHV